MLENILTFTYNCGTISDVIREHIPHTRATAFTEYENLKPRSRKTGCFTVKLFFAWYCIWSTVVSVQEATVIWADFKQKEKKKQWVRTYGFVNRSRNSLRVSEAAVHKHVCTRRTQGSSTARTEPEAWPEGPLSLPATKSPFASVSLISFRSKACIYFTLTLTCVLVLNSFLLLSFTLSSLLIYSFSLELADSPSEPTMSPRWFA